MEKTEATSVEFVFNNSKDTKALALNTRCLVKDRDGDFDIAYWKWKDYGFNFSNR